MVPKQQSQAVLLAVGELLGREIALDSLLRMLMDRIAVSMGADRATLYLVDSARGELFSKVAHLPELQEIRLKLGQGLAGHVALTGELLNVPSTRREVRFFDGIDRRTGYRSHSMLAAPMRDSRGQVIGVVQLLNKKEGAFSRADEERLKELASQAAQALEATSLYSELRRAESDPVSPLSYQFNHVIGESPAMQAVYRAVSRAATTPATVLIRGESGTGKELIARAIQVNGDRRDKPFIKVDCAALPADLIENELFGHERGAYTGATSRAVGKFEAAHGGTVFIDELGELPLSVQGKLLRVLQDRQFERVGGTQTVSVDVRIIAATHRNLERLVQEGRFRADLYYRIKVVELTLPPLRARGEGDIRRLAQHFAVSAARRYRREVPRVSEEAMASLVRYPWPGNVRELENCIESAVILCDDSVIQAEDLPLPARAPLLDPPGELWVSPEHGAGERQGVEGGGGLRLGSGFRESRLARGGEGQAAGGPGVTGEAVSEGVDRIGEAVLAGAAGEGGASLRLEDDLTLERVERQHILGVLELVKGNRSLAARVLGIGRNTLARKLKEAGLSEEG